MKFSLIQICEIKEDGTISGWWVQDHHGTLETAIAKMKATVKVNSSRLTIPVAGSHYMQYAVTEQVVGPCPIHRYLMGLVPLERATHGVIV